VKYFKERIKFMDNEDVINDVDLNKRYDDEWADIYHIKILNSDYINNSKMDEFEWSYFLVNHANYQLIPKFSKKNQELDYSIPEEMETRAIKINRDIFSTADKHEKKILQNNTFVATKYILNYRCKK